ncbi:leucine-rich repeat-containing protein kinase family protein [Dankookia sp. GCM10030260]|uniref:leucine-rich repeat-containing protein kinase family protein n=1 Tax=Dankookia sp. GCM10030260 TaxID=3273390 RepID=UPI003621FF53
MTAAEATLAALRRGDLAGTRVLRLAGLGLREVPAEILGLAESLELLDLSGNALEALPPGLARCRRLRVFFGSGNRFGRLPPVLGDCPALGQVGCRGSALVEVPAEALAPGLRWLTLTDNHLTALPPAVGERPALQKLMLSGNRLERLPPGLAGAGRLELLRIAANRFESLPPWLADLPRLAWLAMAGNPCEDAGPAPAGPLVDWSALTPGALLGEGASGRIHAASWAGRPVALKLFKGSMTSDGLPEREMAACLAAGAHPHLVGALGRLAGHPEALQGLVMPLLPPDWRPLAGPPSLESCSRDIYDPALRLAPAVALRIARGIGAAAAHLHAQALLHGDLYAHNVLWDGAAGAAVLSDLGAAACLPSGAMGMTLQRLEVRAWGLLLGELLDRCDEPLPAAARAVERACVQPAVAARPLLAEALAMLPA